jgi:PleD family two-component response regulator
MLPRQRAVSRVRHEQHAVKREGAGSGPGQFGFRRDRSMSGASEPAEGGAKPRILATDDRPEVLRLIERSLGERYECEFATSVEEARGKLAGEPFELALCDVQMAGASGLAWSRRSPAGTPRSRS